MFNTIPVLIQAHELEICLSHTNFNIFIGNIYLIDFGMLRTKIIPIQNSILIMNIYIIFQK